MKKMTLGLLLCWFALQGLAADESKWLTDLPTAQAQAKKDGKLVLMDFTGSDWCPACIKLHKEVFSTPEFSDYAKKNLVLVKVDFPHKTELPADVKKSNDALREKFNIEGFPTIIVLNGEGKKLNEVLGYDSSGPKAFIANLDKLKK